MTPETAVQIIKDAMMTAMWVCAPLLLLAFVVGVLINLVQIVTSLQDTAFSTIPRLAVFLIGLLILLPWMLNRLMTYTITLFGDLARHAR